jgi:dTDP-4-amino-4,6-dideoxygalactose transaminase
MEKVLEYRGRTKMCDRQRREYEERFSTYVGALEARAFGLGRHALVILLKALGIHEGDKVGVCGYTCFAVVEAVKVCGAVPVYLDVDEHLCIEPEAILRQESGRLKVVILQHTFGVPGRLEQLLSTCEKVGAKIVEDCAHSLGCFWKGEHLGKFGEGAIYSFEWGKPYTTGQGGMLTVNTKTLLDEVDRQIEELALPASRKSEWILECERRMYQILGRTKLRRYLLYMYNKFSGKGPFMAGSEFCLYRGYVRLGGEMTVRAGLKKLRNWPKLMQLRRENTEMTKEHLSKAGLPLWPKPDEADVTMLRYPVPTPHKSRTLKLAREQNLDIAAWYTSPVNPLQGDDLAKVDYEIGSCPKTEDMIEQLVYLPTGLALNRESLEDMIRIIGSS